MDNPFKHLSEKLKLLDIEFMELLNYETAHDDTLNKLIFLLNEREQLLAKFSKEKLSNNVEYEDEWQQVINRTKKMLEITNERKQAAKKKLNIIFQGKKSKQAYGKFGQ